VQNRQTTELLARMQNISLACLLVRGVSIHDFILKGVEILQLSGGKII
jgi:hypothetical protein